MWKSEVLPELQGPIGRRWSAFLIVLSQTPAKAVRPWIRGLVHCVVCPFTPQLSLVLIEEWHAELVLVHSGHGWDSNPWSIASPALYHMATSAPVGIREDNFWIVFWTIGLLYCGLQRSVLSEMDVRRITFLVLYKREFPKYFTYRASGQVSLSVYQLTASRHSSHVSSK